MTVTHNVEFDKAGHDAHTFQIRRSPNHYGYTPFCTCGWEGNPNHVHDGHAKLEWEFHRAFHKVKQRVDR